MANMKIVKNILNLVKNGEIERYKVSNKIKNYPKAEQRDAINYVLKNAYVSLRQSVPSGKGRAAVFISITGAGNDALKIMVAEDDSDTLWKVCL